MTGRVCSGFLAPFFELEDEPPDPAINWSPSMPEAARPERVGLGGGEITARAAPAVKAMNRDAGTIERMGMAVYSGKMRLAKINGVVLSAIEIDAADRQLINLVRKPTGCAPACMQHRSRVLKTKGTTICGKITQLNGLSH